MNIIARFDVKIADKLDVVTTKIQRKGLLPLNTLTMIFECMFFGSWFAITLRKGLDNFPDQVLSVLMALCFYAAYSRWNEARGYWENYRKTLYLNSKVLFDRTLYIVRAIAGVSTILWSPFTLLTPDYLALIMGISLVLSMYLKCCWYIGPGEFSRERKPKLEGLSKPI